MLRRCCVTVSSGLTGLPPSLAAPVQAGMLLWWGNRQYLCSLRKLCPGCSGGQSLRERRGVGRTRAAPLRTRFANTKGSRVSSAYEPDAVRREEHKRAQYGRPGARKAFMSADAPSGYAPMAASAAALATALASAFAPVVTAPGSIRAQAVARLEDLRAGRVPVAAKMQP